MRLGIRHSAWCCDVLCHSKPMLRSEMRLGNYQKKKLRGKVEFWSVLGPGSKVTNCVVDF